MFEIKQKQLSGTVIEEGTHSFTNGSDNMLGNTKRLQMPSEQLSAIITADVTLWVKIENMVYVCAKSFNLIYTSKILRHSKKNVRIWSNWQLLA